MGQPRASGGHAGGVSHTPGGNKGYVGHEAGPAGGAAVGRAIWGKQRAC